MCIADLRHFSPLLPTLSQDHTGFEGRRQVDNVWIVSKDLEKNQTPAHTPGFRVVSYFLCCVCLLSVYWYAYNSRVKRPTSTLPN